MFLRIAASSANAGARQQRSKASEQRRRRQAQGDFMAVIQESSARAVSQRFSGERWLTRVKPRLRSSRSGAGVLRKIAASRR